MRVKNYLSGASPPAMELFLILTALTLALCLGGCTSTLTRDALQRRATRHSLTLYPDATFYCGSQQGFDCFYLEPEAPTTFRRSHRYRVPERENTVSDRFPFTKDRSRWRILVGVDRRAKEPPPRPPGAAPHPPTGAP